MIGLNKIKLHLNVTLVSIFVNIFSVFKSYIKSDYSAKLLGLADNEHDASPAKQEELSKTLKFVGALV